MTVITETRACDICAAQISKDTGAWMGGTVVLDEYSTATGSLQHGQWKADLRPKCSKKLRDMLRVGQNW